MSGVYEGGMSTSMLFEASRRSLCSAALLFCPVLVACSKPSAGTPDASAIAVTPSSRDAGIAAKDAGPPKPTADQRAQVVQALRSGRIQAKAKDWPGALAAFERGLAVSPNEPTLLVESAWAAYHVKDLAKAEAAVRRALPIVKEPQLRSQVLYTSGRIAEAKNDKDSARNAYAESLELRDNAEVKRRLEALGGPPADRLACSVGVNSIQALCACLLRRKDQLMNLGGEEITCRAVPESLSLGNPRVTVVRWGTPVDHSGEAVYLLVAHDGPTYRPVAELGRDYEPGAFGVHNMSNVVGGKMQKVDGREVLVVKSELHNSDMNLAGLEECTDNVEQETVCALGNDKKATRCFVVPVSSESGCGPGVELDPSEMDDATKELLAERSHEWTATSSKLSWSVAADGKLVVRPAGDASAPPGPVGEHPLF